MVVPFMSQNLGVFRQYMASIIAALSMLMIGMSTAWPSPVLLMIRNNMAPVTMNESEISWMVAILFLGNTLSPVPIGLLMDRYGRKRIMYVLNVFPFSGWIITYYAREAWHLYVARFFNGIWAGTSYTVCAVYIGEIAEPEIRGSLSNLNNLLKTVGGLCVFLVGPYVSFKSLALMCGMVSTLFFVAAAFIPESPYFLLMKNQKQQARMALAWLRGCKEVEEPIESELAKMEKAVIEQTNNKGSVKDIFTDQINRKALGIAMILALIKTLSGFDTMTAYLSTTLPETAFTSVGPNECVIILGVISMLSCVGSLFLLDRLPRRVLLTVSSVGCAITCLVAGSWFFFNSNLSIDVKNFAYLPFYCFAIHSVVYSIGLGPIVASVKGEMFSANNKGVCSAIITITFAALNFGASKAYLLIDVSLGMYANYFIYFFGCSLGTIFIHFYVVETRGKTLEEIQEALSQNKKNRVNDQ